MKRRVLTVLLAVCLVFSLGTVTAFADDEDTPVAQIGDTTYNTIDEALSAFTVNTTLVLLDDCTISFFSSLNLRTIDLNGHTLTYNGAQIIIASGQVFSIVDNSAEGGGVLNIIKEREGAEAVISVQRATINMNNITVNSTGCVINPHGTNATVNIENCNITTSGIYCIATNAQSQANYGVNINIVGSSITANASNKDDCAILMNVGGSLYVEDSIVTGNRQGILARAGNVSIVDSEIVVTGAWAAQEENNAKQYYNDEEWLTGNEVPSAAIVVGNRNGNYLADADLTINDSIITSGSNDVSAIYVDATTTPQSNAEEKYSSSVNITGTETVVTGEITNKAESHNEKEIEIVITGGSFADTDVTDYIPAGSSLTQNDNGEIVTDEDATVAEIDGMPYSSLNAAIENVKNGETITVTKDIPDATGISVSENQNFTIDFGGHTYTLTGPGAGSANTETNGFQLLKDSTIVFKNGTIRIAENANNIKRVIQNYANLTLEDMHIYAENQVEGEAYVLSLNYGSIHFKGDTDIITTDDDTIAFDVYFWNNTSYSDGLDVTFDEDYTGTINGVILYDSTNPEKAQLNVNGNGYIGNIVTSKETNNGTDITVTGGTFGNSVADVAITPDYELSGNIGFTYHDTLAGAMAAADEGDIINYVGDSSTAVYTVKLVNNGVTTTLQTIDSIKLPTPDSRSGYTFGGWRSGGTVYEAGETVKVTGDMTFTAIWNVVNIPDTYDIDIADTANGTVSVSLSNASAGSVITVTVEPDEGYELGSLTVTGPDGRVEVTRVNASTYRFTMPDGDVTVRATFVSEGLPFTDVSTSAWYYDAVSYVYANGLMDGVSSTQFNPDGTMTRAMVWAILARIDGQTVTGDGWIETAREWAMSSGVSDGENANGAVTREQLVTMLWRYAGEPEGTAPLSAWSDAASVSDWAAEAMSWAIDNSVITGMSADTLAPQGSATRAQCAAILMRCADLLA